VTTYLKLRAIGFCLGAAAALASPQDGALAQTSQEPQGVLSTKLATSVPAGGPIAVQYHEDTELNRQLSDVISAKLMALGYTVAPGADVVLTFETEVSAPSSSGSNIGIAGQGGSGNRQAFDFSLRLPFGDQQRLRTRTQFRLSLTLTQTGKPPLWGGMALAVVPKTDWLSIESILADRLFGNFGKTIENQPIFLR